MAIDINGIILALRIDMIKKFNSSSIKPIIDSTFKFNDLPSALKYMKEGKHMGKIAIEF